MIKNIIFASLIAGLLFVLYPHIVETINGSSTQTFNVILENSDVAEAIVISSEPYNETQWVVIKNVITEESKNSSDIDYLNKHTAELLAGLSFSIVNLKISRTITKIDLPLSDTMID